MQKYENDSQTTPQVVREEYVPPAIEEVEIETEEIQNDLDIKTNVHEPPKSQNSTNDKTNFSENDFKNGDKNDRYCWSQTLKDIELSILLPFEVKSAKHVKINLKSNHISVKLLLPQEQDIVCGETWSRFKHNEAVWTIADGKIVLSLGKFIICFTCIQYV